MTIISEGSAVAEARLTTCNLIVVRNMNKNTCLPFSLPSLPFFFLMFRNEIHIYFITRFVLSFLALIVCLIYTKIVSKMSFTLISSPFWFDFLLAPVAFLLLMASSRSFFFLFFVTMLEESGIRIIRSINSGSQVIGGYGLQSGLCKKNDLNECKQITQGLRQNWAWISPPPTPATPYPFVYFSYFSYS